MDDATSEAPTCKVCGGPIRPGNYLGICRRNPECSRKRAELTRRARGAKPRSKKQCKHPDGCPKIANYHDWCAMHWLRVQKNGDPGPAAPIYNPPPLIRTGDVFGVWTALDDQEYYLAPVPCLCECGSKRLLNASFLRKGNTAVCICHQKGRPPGRAIGEQRGRPYLAAGAVFGRLTVLEDGAFSHVHVRCLCECGKETTPRAHSLKVGNTRSCGCLQLEVRTTHGLSGHPLYQTWHGMVARCTNPKDSHYPGYGGRGITVCERWLGLPDGLQNFIVDMGPKPSRGHSIDRLNNEGNYEPGNCEWRTWREQNDNRRKVAELTRERDEARAENARLRAENAALRTQLAARGASRPVRRRASGLRAVGSDALF
jgi:hypothetical protein